MFFVVNILFLAFLPLASSPHITRAHKKSCKGTTKNAHTQIKRDFFSKVQCLMPN